MRGTSERSTGQACAEELEQRGRQTFPLGPAAATTGRRE